MDSGSIEIRAETKCRLFPCTSTWLTSGQVTLSFSSRSEGTTYFPCEVLRRSFFRPVMARKPSSR